MWNNPSDRDLLSQRRPESRARPVRGEQDRREILEKPARLRRSAAPPWRSKHVPLAFPALKKIGLVRFHDPAQRLGILPRSVRKPVLPSEGGRRREVAAQRGCPNRLALRQRFPERQPAPLLVQPLKRRLGHHVEGSSAGLAKIAPQTARLALAAPRSADPRPTVSSEIPPDPSS